MNESGFLIRWIGGSAVATLFGLGFGGFVGLMGLHEGSAATMIPSTLVFGAVIAGSVGLAQGHVLADRLPGLSPTRWATQTGTGAILAWLAIAYPVRLLTVADAERPSWLIVILTAAGVGLVVGMIVATAQWFELRRHVKGAQRSIVSLGAAWMSGAVFLFVANGLVEEITPEWMAVSMAAAILFVTGAVVAAIQGFGLVRLLAAASQPGREYSKTGHVIG